MLYAIPYMLYAIYYILYTIYCILYSIDYIPQFSLCVFMLPFRWHTFHWKSFCKREGFVLGYDRDYDGLIENDGIPDQAI